MKWVITQKKIISSLCLLFFISSIQLPLYAETINQTKAPRHDYTNEPEDVFGGQPYITYIPKDVHITGDLTVDGELITPGGGDIYVLKAGDTMSGNLTMANQSNIALGEASANGSETITIHAPASVPSSYSLSLPSTQGSLYGTLINDGSGNLSWQNPREMVALVDGDMNGFVNRTDSTFSFDSGSHTFTIEPTVPGGSYTIYYGGQEVIKNNIDSLEIDDSQSGIHFIYFDPINFNLTEYLSFPGFNVGVYVATIYWAAPDNTGYFLSEERHGSKRDTTWHIWAHTTIGTRYENGLDIYGYTPDTDSDSAIKIGIQPGTIADEDNVLTITNAAIPTQFFEQPINYPAAIPIAYKTGTAGIWKEDSATAFPYKNNGAGGLIQFNEHTLVGWQQTTATSGNYVAYWICATNNVYEPIVSIQGQREDTTLDNARDNNTIQSLDASGLPFEEVRVLYRIIVQTDNTYTNTIHAIIRDVLDMRSIDIGGLRTLVPLQHSNLIGLNQPASHPASAIATTPFTQGILIGQTDVQGALDAIDFNINQSLNTTSSPTFAGMTTTAPILADGGINVTGPGGTLNIGTSNTSIINIGSPTTTVNIPGTLIAPIVVNPEVEGKTISLNKADPAMILPTDGCGVIVLDGINPAGGILTSGDSASWEITAPSAAGTVTISPGASGFTINQGSHDPITLGTANGLSLTGPASPLSPNQVLNLQTASGAQPGALSATDWNTFNNKQNQSPTLDALALLSSTGFIVETNIVGPTFGSRNLVGTPNQVIITNGNGILANPVFSLPQDIALTSTPTFASTILTAGTNQLVLSAPNTITINAPSPTGARIYTLPDAGTNSNFVMTDGNQTINGNKTLSGTTNLSALTASLPLQLDASKNVVSQEINLASSQVTGVLPPANGGTGSSTPLNNNRILVSQSGSIVEAAALTNGQMLIGSTGVAPVAAALTGTTNQVIVTNGAGSITLSTPQNINTAATPTFASETLSATTNQLSLGTTNTTTINATAPAASRTYTIPDSGANSNFVMTDGNQIINGNKTLSGTTNLSALTASLPLQLDASKNVVSQAINIGTVGITGTLPIANGGTNSSTALNNNRIMVSSGSSIVEATALTNGQLLIGSTGAAPIAANITGTANQVSVTNGAGSITLAIPSAVILTGASSINSSSSTIAIGDSATTTLTLGRTGQTTAVASTLNVDSGIIDRTAAGTLSIGGTNVTTLNLGKTGQTTAILGNHTIAGTTVASGSVTLNATNELRFADSDSSNYVGFKSGATIASNVVWTLPTSDGTSGQVLSTNGAQTLSWTSPSSSSEVIQFATPLTGSTVTVNNTTTTLILAPATTLSTLTITLPSTPSNGQKLNITSIRDITGLTINGGTQATAITQLTGIANRALNYIYYQATNTWYLIGNINQ